MANIDDWKPEVGIEVFIVPSDTGRKPRTDTIAKVGKKYFYVGKNFMTQYFINTKNENNGEYRSQSHCYRCEADFLHVVELRDKRQYIERNIYKLTDEQVKMVYEWIKSNNYKK